MLPCRFHTGFLLFLKLQRVLLMCCRIFGKLLKLCCKFHIGFFKTRWHGD
jgi:hypothetical protein